MSKHITTFTEAFKKEVAIEALRERMSVDEIAAKHGISASMVSNWKNEFVTGGFSEEIQQYRKELTQSKEKIDEVQKELEKLNLENELLKKKWNL